MTCVGKHAMFGSWLYLVFGLTTHWGGGIHRDPVLELRVPRAASGLIDDLVDIETGLRTDSSRFATGCATPDPGMLDSSCTPGK